MKLYGKSLRLVLALFTLSCVSSCASNHQKVENKVTFSSQDGKSIELDFERGELRWPDGRIASLVECGNSNYTCVYSGSDLTLALPKQCGQDLVIDAAHARFSSVVIVALHNDAWIVFDRSPHLMLHYAAPMGVIGIYVPRLKSFDFRSLLQRTEVNLETSEFDEYKIVGEKRFAACN